MSFKIANKLKAKNYKNEVSECFICFEILQDKTKPIKLISQEKYVKNCTCNGLIHINCLDKWYNISKKCPICRECITKKSDILIIKKENFYYIFIYRNFYKIIKISIIFLFIYKLYISVKI